MTGGVLRALVVEDDRSWQQILHEVLGDMGLAVDVAADLAQATARLREQAYRLAVVDLSLHPEDPENQDGLRALEAVRHLQPGCVSMLLTGYATVELAVSVLTQQGAFTCLRKEAFRREQFRALVQRALLVAPLGSAGTAGPADAPPGQATTAEVQARQPAAGAALLVEDDAGWQSILAELLAECGYQVQTSASFGEALGHLRRGGYRLAVVDLSLASSTNPSANRDGYQVLAGAAAAGIPALVVSGLATPAELERAYAEYGILAYLEKQGFNRRAFREAVEQAARAGRPRGELDLLTAREREVLALAAQGLTNKGIANALVISTNTVKRYLKSIFRKLGVDSRAAAVAKAIGAGMKAGSPRG